MAWKQSDFIKFIQSIRFDNPRVPFVIYSDNLTILKMNIVKYVYEKLFILSIINTPYCTVFNQIKSVWSKVKRVFNTDRLKKLAALEPFNAEGFCVGVLILFYTQFKLTYTIELNQYSFNQIV
jgi:hypothetical protein